MFIAQATNTDLSVSQQLGLLAIMLLTSKGAAGVAGGGFIALTATLSTAGHIPANGIMMIFGIDKFMSECRALVNFCGNAVATLFIGKWTRTLDVDQARAVLDQQAVPELGDTPIRQPEIAAPEPVITDDEYDRHRFDDHQPSATRH
jgi:aerobic C4-dicarboxylate transport protein